MALPAVRGGRRLEPAQLHHHRVHLRRGRVHVGPAPQDVPARVPHRLAPPGAARRHAVQPQPGQPARGRPRGQGRGLRPPAHALRALLPDQGSGGVPGARPRHQARSARGPQKAGRPLRVRGKSRPAGVVH